MERSALIKGVRETLAKAGFYVSDPCNTQGISFDVMARRDDLLLIIKALVNVDAYTKQHAHEIKILAKILKGTPILVGERCGQGALETGVLYQRHGISMLTAKTLDEYFIEGVPPFVYAAHGGFYVNIDVDLLKKVRQDRKLSLGQVAEAAGVSRKSVQMYEEGANPTVDVGMRLEEFLENSLLVPLSLNKHPKEIESHDDADEPCKVSDGDDLESRVFRQLNELGYVVFPTEKCPFDALTSDVKLTILTGVGRYDRGTQMRARAMFNISRVAERHSVFIVEDSKRTNLEGTPVIEKRELEKLRDTDELLRLIMARKGRAKAD